MTIPHGTTHIRRDRYGLSAVVTVQIGSTTGTTTMRPDVRPSDPEIADFKRSLLHMRRIKTDGC